MNHKNIKLSIILLITFGFSCLQAQESTTAAGGYASGSGGNVSYSVGQVVYTSILGTTGSVSQGVQQVYEISDISEIEGLSGINLSLKIYPNPATHFLVLKVDKDDFTRFRYQFYDLNGKLVKQAEITNNETTISMEGLTAATYFLKVFDSKTELKTFKIIKN